MKRTVTIALMTLSLGAALAACRQTSLISTLPEETAAPQNENDLVIALFDGETLISDDKTLTARTLDGCPTFVFTNGEGRIKTVNMNDCRVSTDTPDCIRFEMPNAEYPDYPDSEVTVYTENGALHSASARMIAIETEDEYIDYDGTYGIEGHAADGTEAYPWRLGDVSASITNTTLYLDGEGEMPDFASPADSPWHDVIGELDGLFIWDGITHIGDNAFAKLGENTDGVTLFFGSESIESIGENAFCGAKITDIVTIPESVKKIGARAFAETPTTELYFNGQPDDIAPDAFAGCKTDIYYINDTFGEAMRRDYGGTLTYHCLYRFNANYIYVGSEDEINGSGTSFLPEGELYDTDLSPYEEEWAFSHFEVTEGSLPEDIDPNDPHITFTPCGDVSLNVYYEAAGAQG